MQLGAPLTIYGRFLFRSFNSAMKQYFSVRTQSAMMILRILVEIAVWTIFAGLVGPSIGPNLAEYGADNMVTFVLSGLIISSLVDMAQIIRTDFFRMAYTGFHNRPLNMWAVAAITSIDHRFFWRLVNFGTYLTVATLFFGVSLRLDSAAFWLIIGLGAIFRLGLNLFAAGWAIVTKGEEDPVSWFYDATSMLLTGQFFPVTVLPSYLVLVAKAHPKAYVQLLARKAALGGAKIGDLLSDTTVLAILSVVFFIGGFLMLRLCINRAKREGTMKWA